MTPLQLIERDAMTGNREAVLQVVSALRLYRAAVEKALASRYQDGAIVGADSSRLESAAADIEEMGEESES